MFTLVATVLTSRSDTAAGLGAGPAAGSLTGGAASVLAESGRTASLAVGRCAVPVAKLAAYPTARHGHDYATCPRSLNELETQFFQPTHT